MSNYAAGALDGLTGNLVGSAFGVDGSCAGPGYGLGKFVGQVGGTLYGVTKAGAEFQKFQEPRGPMPGFWKSVGYGAVRQGSNDVLTYTANDFVKKYVPQVGCGC